MIEFKYSEAVEEALSELDKRIAEITQFYSESIFPFIVSQEQLDYHMRRYYAAIDQYVNMKVQIVSKSVCRVILSGEDAERFERRLKDEGSIK